MARSWYLAVDLSSCSSREHTDDRLTACARIMALMGVLKINRWPAQLHYFNAASRMITKNILQFIHEVFIFPASQLQFSLTIFFTVGYLSFFSRYNTRVNKAWMSRKVHKKTKEAKLKESYRNIHLF